MVSREAFLCEGKRLFNLPICICWSTCATLVGRRKNREHYMILHHVNQQFMLISKE